MTTDQCQYITGVDPGATGALVTLDIESKSIWNVIDVPCEDVAIAGKRRKRIVVPGLLQDLRSLTSGLWSEHFFVLEHLKSGYPRQSTQSTFGLGYNYGVMDALLVASGHPVGRITPQKWKAALNVAGLSPPGRPKLHKTKAALAPQLLERLYKLFPLAESDKPVFVSARGAYRVDRIEAALLAVYGLYFEDYCKSSNNKKEEPHDV